MKRVTPEEYTEKLREHQHEVYSLELAAWQVPLFHGLIALAADHPGMKKLSPHTHQTIQEIREWCKDVFARWGFSPEEVEYLDKIREQSNEGR